MNKLTRNKGRMCIYATDVALLTGRSYKTSLKILREIREAYQKPESALVTYKEFAAFMNLDEDEVFDFLK